LKLDKGAEIGEVAALGRTRGRVAALSSGAPSALTSPRGGTLRAARARASDPLDERPWASGGQSFAANRSVVQTHGCALGMITMCAHTVSGVGEGLRTAPASGAPHARADASDEVPRVRTARAHQSCVCGTFSARSEREMTSMCVYDARRTLRRAPCLGKITGDFSKKVSRLTPCCFTLTSFLLCLVQGKP
jgi:hypothetical protein